MGITGIRRISITIHLRNISTLRRSHHSINHRSINHYSASRSSASRSSASYSSASYSSKRQFCQPDGEQRLL